MDYATIMTITAPHPRRQTRPIPAHGAIVAIAAVTCLVMSVTTMGATYYVSAANGSDTNNGLSWATAKNTIQAAVFLTANGDTVLVTNGIYASGGSTNKTAYLGVNRVMVTKKVRVHSVNGPAATIIVGAPGYYVNMFGTIGSVRCVWLGAGATLSGFTLSDGYAISFTDGGGGGVCCATLSAVVSNCVIVNCEAESGAGAYGGSIYCSEIYNNYAKCDYLYADDANGAAAAYSALYSCVVKWNRLYVSQYFDEYNSALYNCTAWNTLVVDNYTRGTSMCNLYNCTVANNDGSYGRGVFTSRENILVNCIVWSNSFASWSDDIAPSNVVKCCIQKSTLPGVITANPRFIAAGNYRLQPGSPCRNTGTNAAYVFTTLDASMQQRFRGTSIDIGAYEYVEPTPPCILTRIVWCAVRKPMVCVIRTYFNPVWFGAENLPTGCVINASSGIISGIPAVTGIYQTIITSTNTEGISSVVITMVVCDQFVDLAIAMKETSAVVLKAFSEDGESWYEEVGKGALSIRAKAPCTAAIDFTAMSDQKCYINAGDLVKEFDLADANKLDAGQIVYKEANKEAKTSFALTLKKNAATFSLAITAKNGNAPAYHLPYSMVANRYLTQPSRRIATRTELAVRIGNTLWMNGDAVLHGTKKVKNKNTRDGTYNLPSVSLKSGKMAKSLTPVLDMPPGIACNWGVPFSYELQASRYPTNFSAKGLPPGLSIEPNLGIIGGTTTNAGDYKATVYAANVYGKSSAPLPVHVLGETTPTTTIATIKASESLKDSIKSTGSGEERSRDVVTAYRIAFSAHLPWSGWLDFSMLQAQTLSIQAGGMSIACLIGDADKLTADAVSFVVPEETESGNATKLVVKANYNRKAGTIMVSVRTACAEYCIAADSFKGTSGPIETTCPVVIGIGQALTAFGDVPLYGMAKVITRIVGGEENGEEFELDRVTLSTQQ